MVPNGKPIAVARSHAGQERFQSAADIRIEPLHLLDRPGDAALVGGDVERLADREQARPRAPPRRRRRAARARRRRSAAGRSGCRCRPARGTGRGTGWSGRARVELPSTAATVMKANTISAKYSAGPNLSARSTTSGASSVSRMVAMVPATNEPMALVASAGPARPGLRHLVALERGGDRGRLARRVEQDGGGRAAEHRAVVDAGEHDERAGRVELHGERQQHRHGERRARRPAARRRTCRA